MQLNHLIPEFYVSNFNKSLDFYTKILNFKLEYSRKSPDFAFLSYQNSQIMIQQENNDQDWENAKPEYPFGRGINFQINTTEISNLINIIKINNYPLKKAVFISSYKANTETLYFKEFLIMDPDGYLLRFSQTIDAPSKAA
jgi:catechol 2,3-dioxygenase-like lactoylglutathione lyase family enzyme